MAARTEAQQRATLERLEKFSRFTDSSIGIPFTKFQIGAVYKANTRNTKLLKNYLEKQLEVEPPPPPFPWKTLIGLSILFAVVTGGLTLIF